MQREHRNAEFNGLCSVRAAIGSWSELEFLPRIWLFSDESLYLHALEVPGFIELGIKTELASGGPCVNASCSCWSI
jgi:hypothetical protein